jgi:ribosomal protein L12E/L44/L45/RPP1/RPP2
MSFSTVSANAIATVAGEAERGASKETRVEEGEVVEEEEEEEEEEEDVDGGDIVSSL